MGKNSRQGLHICSVITILLLGFFFWNGGSIVDQKAARKMKKHFASQITSRRTNMTTHNLRLRYLWICIISVILCRIMSPRYSIKLMHGGHINHYKCRLLIERKRKCFKIFLNEISLSYSRHTNPPPTQPQPHPLPPQKNTIKYIVKFTHRPDPSLL